jgi:hypothetical protein
VLTSDQTFRGAIADPRRFRVSYFLVPDPQSSPQDAVNRGRPALWRGREAGFVLVKRFRAVRDREEWRLYGVTSDVRPRLKGSTS